MSHKVTTLAAAYLKHKTLDYDLSAADIKAAYQSDPQRYAAAHAETAMLVRRLAPVMLAEIERQGQTQLLDKIEFPFAAVLAVMEWEGVRIDTAELQSQSRKLTSRLSSLEQQVYELAGTVFNLGSPMQVGEVLFGKLQLDPSAKRTKRGAWSTTEETLEK